MWSYNCIPGVHRWRSQQGGPHHPVNSYLVETTAGPVLVDPSADLAPEELPSAPVAILVTHVQAEHIDGAANFPGVPLYVPAGDAYICDGLVEIEPWEEPWDWETRGSFPGHVAGARNERQPRQAQQVAVLVQPGDSFFGFEVLATPGHGKHAVTYLLRREDQCLAFCGDLICGDGQLWNWFDAEWDYGLQGGQRALLASAHLLLEQRSDQLLPAHGEIIPDPAVSLHKLIDRLQRVLFTATVNVDTINFEHVDSPAPGFRQLSTHLHQWCATPGNCAVLVSKSGAALLVDDGLCHWVPLPEREAHHALVMRQMKAALGVERIEVCIPTHYHGDHLEHIPKLVGDEGTEVVSLDCVADAIFAEAKLNLAASLWWYDTGDRTIPIHRVVPSGTRVKWHEYELEIFHLAGQTYYHAGIQCEVDGGRVIFVGDAIYGWDERCEPVQCYNDNEPGQRGWAYSVERLLEREPDLLVCGHASAVRQPMPLLRSKQQNWEMRLRDFAALNARSNLRAFVDPFFETES